MACKLKKTLKKPAATSADQRLYRVNPPVVHPYDDSKLIRHVVISAVNAFGDPSAPETYVFESDGSGRILDWTELPGSFKGALDHDRAARQFEERNNSVPELNLN